MAIAKGMNPNHPKKGSIIRVDPIRDRDAIKQIRELLEPTPLYYCIFVLGINTNLRASDLLSIKWSEVKDALPMEELELREKKTGKIRRVPLNGACIEAIQRVINGYENGVPKVGLRLMLRTFVHEDVFFLGQRGQITVGSLSRLVKGWCRKVGLKGNYGAHTLRKTWAFQQYTQYGVKVPVLMKCMNHSSERQVLTYIGIQEKEVLDVFENEI